MTEFAPRTRRRRLAAPMQWGICYVLGSALIIASLLILGDVLPW